jgi:hypothetical protein
MLLDVVVHIHNEPPIMADLLNDPAPADVTLTIDPGLLRRIREACGAFGLWRSPTLKARSCAFTRG